MEAVLLFCSVYLISSLCWGAPALVALLPWVLGTVALYNLVLCILKVKSKNLEGALLNGIALLLALLGFIMLGPLTISGVIVH